MYDVSVKLELQLLALLASAGQLQYPVSFFYRMSWSVPTAHAEGWDGSEGRDRKFSMPLDGIQTGTSPSAFAVGMLRGFFLKKPTGRVVGARWPAPSMPSCRHRSSLNPIHSHPMPISTSCGSYVSWAPRIGFVFRRISSCAPSMGLLL